MFVFAREMSLAREIVSASASGESRFPSSCIKYNSSSIMSMCFFMSWTYSFVLFLAFMFLQCVSGI